MARGGVGWDATVGGGVSIPGWKRKALPSRRQQPSTASQQSAGDGPLGTPCSLNHTLQGLTSGGSDATCCMALSFSSFTVHPAARGGRRAHDGRLRGQPWAVLWPEGLLTACGGGQAPAKPTRPAQAALPGRAAAVGVVWGGGRGGGVKTAFGLAGIAGCSGSPARTERGA